MINKKVKLNEKLFSSSIEKSPIRNGFGIGLKNAGEKDERVVALCADLTESTKMNQFRDAFPERFIEVGIGEQSMASVASGVAAMGKIPFLSSYAMFSPGRNWEQIRTTICYNNVNVKIIGSHAGVSVGPDGGTHQAIEDIAITRVIPKINVIVPCDEIEARKATEAVAKINAPCYIRLQRENTSIITTKDTPFEIGKIVCYFESENPQITIFACGGVLYNALLAAKELEEVGIGVQVYNVSTIKPLDEKIIDYLKGSSLVVTIEEHQRIGGLGGAISEFLSERHPIRIYRIGIDDKFGESGEPEQLLKKHKLDKDSIVEKIKSII